MLVHYTTLEKIFKLNTSWKWLHCSSIAPLLHNKSGISIEFVDTVSFVFSLFGRHCSMVQYYEKTSVLILKLLTNIHGIFHPVFISDWIILKNELDIGSSKKLVMKGLRMHKYFECSQIPVDQTVDWYLGRRERGESNTLSVNGIRKS